MNLITKWSLASCILLLGSCATVKKVHTTNVDTRPVISPALQQQKEYSKKGPKRKVAIARFTNETSYGKGFFKDQNNDPLGKQAVDILSAKLMNTGKFILLERADYSQIERELALEGKKHSPNSADYIIVGSITEFGRKETSDTGMFTRVKKQTAYAKVFIRLVEVATGRIIYSEQGEGEAFSEAGTTFGLGKTAGYDTTLNDKVLESAISHLSSNVIENLLEQPWKSYILGYEEGNLIISGGSRQNIKPGEQFDVFRRGKIVNNPQTNMKIELPGKKIGSIQIISSTGSSVEDEVSFCSIVRGDLSSYINSQNFFDLYIGESSPESIVNNELEMGISSEDDL